MTKEDLKKENESLKEQIKALYEEIAEMNRWMYTVENYNR